MSNRYWISVAVIAVAALAAGMYVARLVSAPPVVVLESGTALPQPRVLAPFALIDTNGSAADVQIFTGHPTLVFFGFTHCPDVCPTTLALLASVQKQAAREEPALANLKVALISVDPERDTPELLGKYVSAFGGDFIGLTGPAPDISAVSRSFGVASSRVDLGGGNYTMDHSATVFALDSAGRIVAIFTPPMRAATLTRDVVKLAPVLARPS